MDSLATSFLPKISINPKRKPSLPPISTTIFAAQTDVRPQTTTRSPPPQTTTTTRSPPQTTRSPPPRKAKKPPPSPSPSPPPPPPISLSSAIFNQLDNFINTFIDPPSKPSTNPRHVLSGNFSPVSSELPPTPCHVITGSLPPALDGVYIRNGPNAQFLPRGPYHLFDGDGMLHAIKITDGKATLCSRYVKTYKYEVENRHGGPVVANVFSGFNGLAASAARGALTATRMLAGQFDPTRGFGLANTSLALIGGKLYALGESDLPYEIRVDGRGESSTVGRADFDGKLVMSMTAHPKTDPETGETFAFRYGPFPPYLTLFRVGPTGEKHGDVPVFSMTSPAFMHDFAVTKKYAVFNEMQIGMNVAGMFSGEAPVGADKGRIPRIGVIPRYAKDESEIRWFEVPGFNIVHAINAWDDGGGGEGVVELIGPNILSVEHTMERMDLIHACVEKVRIDLRTGLVSRVPLSTRNLDFGVINPAYTCKKSRYVYAGVGDPMPKITGVVKLDVSISDGDRCDCIVASRLFGPGCYGGEPFFVAKEPDNPNAEEDDGYLVTYVHNENDGESRFLVMDATSENLDVVAEVKLPRRVPYGFHGLFVRQRDLDRL